MSTTITKVIEVADEKKHNDGTDCFLVDATIDGVKCCDISVPMTCDTNQKIKDHVETIKDLCKDKNKEDKVKDKERKDLEG